MQGLELARSFYREYGEPMLLEAFKEEYPFIAAGLVGDGSECLGYDDDISKDHDFDAGFCLWIPAAKEHDFGFKLERAYAKLPKEYLGHRRALLSPVGGNRHGVIVTEEFYTRFLGAPNAPDSIERWLYTPSYSLLAASNGEVFYDGYGQFSEIRNILLKGYPDDIRLKKISAHAVLMAQAGQYNFFRCVKRGENGAAQLAAFEFIKHALSAVYLINNSYEPYYKWVYRGLRDLKKLAFLENDLVFISQSTDNKAKGEKIESICSVLADEFRYTGISDTVGDDLERHAYSIRDNIKDNAIRNMHIMDGV